MSGGQAMDAKTNPESATMDRGVGDTATRLRERMRMGVEEYGGVSVPYLRRKVGEPDPETGDQDWEDYPDPTAPEQFEWAYQNHVDAALDTLIAYHRAASAVEAWQLMEPLLHAVGCLDTLMDQFELYEPWYAANEARAAAQARLALLEQEAR